MMDVPSDVYRQLLSVERQHADLVTALDSAHDSIGICDANGIMLWCNAACERLYGLRRSDCIGQNVLDLEAAGYYTPSAARLVLRSQRRITATQHTCMGRTLLVTGTPIRGEDGTIQRVVVNTRDVTELQELRALLSVKEEEINRYQTEIENLRRGQLRGAELIASSGPMKAVLDQASRVARFDSTVLLLGETGVGKSRIANLIHRLSRRSTGPFVTISCGAVPETLLESELFGYERGAFTGARQDGKPGLMEIAAGGTLFLDEVGELPLAIQAKLLHVIQERQFTRVGGSRPVRVDVRFIAATNRDLETEVSRRRFRQDLYYRLNVVPVRVPPLRERPQDIALLIQHFVKRFNARYGVQRRITPQACELLLRYSWPGNVRELENIVERVLVMADGPVTVEDLPHHVRYAEPPAEVRIDDLMPLAEAVNKVERALLVAARQRLGSTRRIARALGISQPTVVRKLRAHGFESSD